MFHRIVIPALVMAAHAYAADLTKISFRDAEGKRTSLQAYEGKAVLIVNVASKCGLTSQYKALEALHRQHKDAGLVVIGFPCNDFGGQEPGTMEEIQTFCKTKYDVTFPLMEKISVKGEDQHKLYKELTGERGVFPGDVTWNFGKFLIGKDGKAIARFEPKIAPDSPELVAAVQTALAK